jgi:hypothetical protein
MYDGAHCKERIVAKLVYFPLCIIKKRKILTQNIILTFFLALFQPYLKPIVT